MSNLSYKGYSASISLDADDSIFYGKVLNIYDRIVFSGESITELKTNFQIAIDNYIACCKEIGGEPEKPASGKILLRLHPDTHSKVIREAKKIGKSINRWISDAIEDKISQKEHHVILLGPKPADTHSKSKENSWGSTSQSNISPMQ